jgi:hypothetical protein
VSRRDPWWLAVVRWPLWSWRRLVTTVVVALVLGWGAGVGQSWLARLGSPPTGTATAAPTTESPFGPTGTPTGAVPTGAVPTETTSTTAPSTANGPTAVDVPAGAVAVAREFVTAWARPDLAPDVWWQSLNPLCTSTFAAQLHQTDPSRVPAHRLVGELSLAPPGAAATPQPPSASAGAPAVGTQVVLLAPTDAGGVLVSVVLEGAGWLVSDVEPAGAPPAASTAVPEASVAGTSNAQAG